MTTHTRPSCRPDDFPPYPAEPAPSETRYGCARRSDVGRSDRRQVHRRQYAGTLLATASDAPTGSPL